MKRMMSLLYTLITIYVLIVLVMFVFQRKLMYFPDRTIAAPAMYGLADFEDTRAKTDDNITIQLWYKQAKDSFPTIVYFHGNAGNIGTRAGIYHALSQKGFGVLGVSYRGYGNSEGTPDEQGLYRDARAAIRFLTEQKSIPIDRIMIYGESLGTGVSVQMATEFNIAGLMLQAPYKSVVGRAAEIYFYIPVRLLIRDAYDSINKIAKVKAPLVIFHGERDTIIPIRHGKAMFEAATSPKQAHFWPHVAHNDFDSDLISSHVLEFAKQQHLITSP